MTPEKIKLNLEEGSLLLEYADGSRFTLTGEYLRVHSPSAEVRVHGKGQGILQSGKHGVRITHVAPSGNYALQVTFSDGHDSGIFTWDYLRDLAINYERYWQDYLSALEAAGEFREPDRQVVRLIGPTRH
ncbi:gamma-butyrobetaine hydroxylase-like domain-containing protein [Porticoccus sp.]|uniref:gamma-butyrobetaine hydroxylase-like domain-containing protein n=1 Tax=Porticoccus sp. TaxID=2024853 RepID=UPI003F696A56